MTMLADTPFTLAGLAGAIAAGARPTDIVAEVFRRIEAVDDPGIFIHLADRDALLAVAEALGAPDPSRALWGIPFAVKDNIDVAGMPTTAACPAFAYTPAVDAFVVARLKAAGALVIGKTNLDQFATGLVGVRTPYPVPRNAIDPAVVPGGSSSGSAVAVAHGIVPFALGTDTAGSGRVPAALNNIAGLKPSLGALSATGVVPACRTVDTISIFALTVADAYAVYRTAAGYDAADPWSRPVATPAMSAVPDKLVIAVPDAASIRFDGDAVQAENFRANVAALAACGHTIREIDFAPLYAIAELLYEGAWVAERHAAIEPTLSATPEAVHPVTRAVIEKALGLSATDAFRDQYRLAELRRLMEPVLAAADIVCVPTVPTFYTVADLAADPIGPNTRLGTYTNFVNLLDLCGLAVPALPRGDGRPGSVTLLAAHGRDGALASLAATVIEPLAGPPGATSIPRPAAPALDPGATDGEIEIAVCGAHMSGMALNHQLTTRGGRYLRTVDTTADYRLYALPGGPPQRPGLVRVPSGGAAIAVEVWTLPTGEVGSFLAGIPAPLGLGTTTLADGTAPKGFICEAAAAATAEDVSAYKSWRNYTARPLAQA